MAAMRVYYSIIIIARQIFPLLLARSHFHAMSRPVFHVLGAMSNARIGCHVVQVATNHDCNTLHVGS